MPRESGWPFFPRRSPPVQRVGDRHDRSENGDDLRQDFQHATQALTPCFAWRVAVRVTALSHVWVHLSSHVSVHAGFFFCQ